MKTLKIDIVSCGNYSMGRCMGGAWVWTRPCIGKVAGTAGNLTTLVRGIETLVQEDPFSEETFTEWVYSTMTKDSHGTVFEEWEEDLR